MNARRDTPGFVSATGIVITAVVAVVLVGVFALTGAAMFSPGGLSAATRTGTTLGGVTDHAQLGRNCSACHSAPWSRTTMADKCMACHRDVADQIRSDTGLHGKLPIERTSPTCKGCHPDHRGPKGELTDLNAATFPHDDTGYSLAGHRGSAEGAKVTCKDCHPAGYARFDQTACQDCHAKLDQAFMTKHVADYGSTCTGCHDGSGRDGKDFDHSKFAFKLEGKHAAVACNACHTPERSSKPFKDTPTDCYACHAKDDKHSGSFGQQCGECHNPGTWKDAKFDHTVFPIDHGGGGPSPCKTCHPKDTSSYDCFGCHEHTPTNVVAQHEGKGLADLKDCVRCHKGGRGGG